MRSERRILTTHAGSLPRPSAVLAAREDRAGFEAALKPAVAEVVRQQVACGIDVINDGELSKPNFVAYVGERITGFELRELRADEEHPQWSAVRRDERESEFGDYFRRRGAVFVFNNGAAPGGSPPPSAWTRISACVGPLKYTGHDAVRRDIANLQAAARKAGSAAAFLPAPSPGVVAHTTANDFYPTDEAYVAALADALHEEYQAIVDAGLMLQVDAPDLLDDWQRQADMTVGQYRAYAGHQIELLNHALRGIDPERVRLHTCWGSWHGPHVTDLPLKDIVDVVLTVCANTFSIEGANVRHEHEWRVWEDVKLPEGKALVPGVVGHASDFVEHPRLIADRLVQVARLVGRENVMAGTDCGLSRVGHEQVAWSKLRALAEGAALATRELWGKESV